MVERAVIVGASGGIGAALVDALRGRYSNAEIWALAREPELLDLANVKTLPADVENESSLVAAADKVAGPIDLVIVASGVLAAPGGIRPERRLTEFDPDAASRIMAINAFGPALVAKHFVPLMPRNRRAVFAAISARVGSISDNRLGGWHSYRASKAALNMLIRNVGIEMARTHPQAIAVTLHPGTVATALSAPFQRNIPAEKLFTTERAANCLLDVLATLTPAESGQCFAWDGTVVPY